MRKTLKLVLKLNKGGEELPLSGTEDIEEGEERRSFPLGV